MEDGNQGTENKEAEDVSELIEETPVYLPPTLTERRDRPEYYIRQAILKLGMIKAELEAAVEVTTFDTDKIELTKSMDQIRQLFDGLASLHIKLQARAAAEFPTPSQSRPDSTQTEESPESQQ